VTEMTGDVEDGRITAYKTTVQVAFPVREDR
jgi:flavin-binding protein dodecin